MPMLSFLHLQPVAPQEEKTIEVVAEVKEKETRKPRAKKQEVEKAGEES